MAILKALQSMYEEALVLSRSSFRFHLLWLSAACFSLSSRGECDYLEGFTKYVRRSSSPFEEFF